MYTRKQSKHVITSDEMSLGLLTLHLQIPGCTSLKEKRSRLKPLLARLHREFNVSAAEMDRLDAWQEAVVACALGSNDAAHTQRALQKVVSWVEANWPDVQVWEERIELVG
jgi:uncharacterized protein YlxP (DUF503 family)